MQIAETFTYEELETRIEQSFFYFDFMVADFKIHDITNLWHISKQSFQCIPQTQTT